jgi:hypothetical protein
MCRGADKQAHGGGEQEDARGDGERAADGIPGRSDEGEDAQVLQAKAGEGEGEDDSGAGEGSIHRWRRRETLTLGGMIRESSVR